MNVFEIRQTFFCWFRKQISVFQSAVETLISLDDLDDLLSGLNSEEIKELSAIDPDVSKMKTSCHFILYLGVDNKWRQAIYQKRENFKYQIDEKKEFLFYTFYSTFLSTWCNQFETPTFQIQLTDGYYTWSFKFHHNKREITKTTLCGP